MYGMRNLFEQLRFKNLSFQIGIAKISEILPW